MRYNLTIESHGLDVAPELRQYVTGKLERPTRHSDKIVSVAVLLRSENASEKERQQTIEVTLRFKGKKIFVEKSDVNLYAAVDRAMDCLDRQVVAHKTKVKDHRHDAPKRVLIVTT